ncbi:MAG: hypothetical protein IJ072_02170, partial [Oscillospiraceae bacterium]|nr:hypothetical protein [Oscillospiraceae bacterium]
VGAEVFSYFEDALIYQLIADMTEKLGYTEEKAWKVLYTGGLTVESTQNSELQAICEEEVNDDIYYSCDAQIAAVVIEHSTGQVKAIVGGRGEKDASLTFNRATDSVRQPGSTIKVLGEYSAALDGGSATLATVYDDAPYTYSDGTQVYNAGGTYSGMTTVHDAIAYSLNIPALKCFQQVGATRVRHYLDSFGLTHLTQEDKTESLALGGTYGGVTDLELTAAYSAIANGGTYIEPSYYTRVLDRNGDVLLERESAQRQVISPDSAALLTYAMEDVMDYGTGVSADVSGASLAGKSGTTNDMVDQWFVGYSPTYACGVWGGYDDNSSPDDSLFVKYVWRAIMERVSYTAYDDSFESTDGLTAKKICTKCGKLARSGICDHTVQGDMTRVEYFAPSTAPTQYCDCHVQVRRCGVSGYRAGSYCPSSNISEYVYLRQGTEGTEDELAVYSGDDTVCPVHRHWWNRVFPNNSALPNGTDETSENDDSNGTDDTANTGSDTDSGGFSQDQNDYYDDWDDNTEDSDSFWDNLFGWFR